MLTKLFGRPIALAALAAALLLVLVIALALIGLQLAGGPAMSKAACRLGLEAECASSALEESSDESTRLAPREKELEELYERLSRLAYASESFVVFYSDNNGPATVTTGHRYKSLIEPGQFAAAWCYIDLPDGEGVNRNIYVAEMDAKGEITPRRLDRSSLQTLGLGSAEIVAARSRCRWPEDVS